MSDSSRVARAGISEANISRPDFILHDIDPSPLLTTATLATNMAANNDFLAYPHKADHYTYRVPTPPRIVVPPPALNADAMPDIALAARHDDPTYAFLAHVDYANLVQSNAPLEWTYERRREAQAILPFLLLGPMTAARDEAALRKAGVTLLLGVRQPHGLSSRLMQSALHAASRLGIEHDAVDLSGPQDLIRAFPRTTARINAHLARNHAASGGKSIGRVLVFCESGNERAAAVVAAFLMHAHADVDHIKAMQLCQAQRFCVNFDDQAKRTLQAYWDILCAQRAVAGAPQPVARLGTPAVAGHVKRSRSRDVMAEAGDDAMEQDGEGGAATWSRAASAEVAGFGDGQEEDDAERFGGRSFAPFVEAPVSAQSGS